MTISTESDPSLYVNGDEVVFLANVRFEKQAAFRMSKAAIESMKRHNPDFKYEYAGLTEAPK